MITPSPVYDMNDRIRDMLIYSCNYFHDGVAAGGRERTKVVKVINPFHDEYFIFPTYCIWNIMNFDTLLG